MKTRNTTPFPRLLKNSPCNEDLFEGGAHQKLAKAIADEITSDKACTIIGIDGGWGSGKSNLVGLIQNTINQDTVNQNKYFFFTYDVWGHQNDLPRRSILEELTSALTDEKKGILKNSATWNEKLKNLLTKKRETTTQVIPQLSPMAIISSILLFTTPLIALICSHIDITWIKIIITTTPYILGYIYVGWKCHKNLKRINDDKKYSRSDFRNMFFQVYNNKATLSTNYENITEKEPSSAQFRAWMTQLDESILKRNKTLIIVFDNMDRLPKNKVQEFWAAIHSFFSETKYNNIRVIVPFDRTHIKNAFQSEDISHNNKENDEIISYGNDFINKTFYVVYQVAPPILSSWRGYFTDRWKEAFGPKSIVDNALLQIYDLMTKEHSPRKIIAFINEFVSIRKIADQAIQDKYIGLYIFGKEHIAKDPLKEIIEPSYLKSLKFLYKDDSNMQQSISALYFQLPLIKATDIIFTRKFTQELDANKVEALAGMRSNPEYWGILDRSVTDISNIENTTLALSTVFSTEISPATQHIWDLVHKRFQSETINNVSIFEEFHAILFSHITEKEIFFKSLISQYHKHINESFDINQYIKGIDRLSSVEEFPVYDYLKSITSLITPKDFIILVSEKGSNYSNYGVTCDANQLDQYISEINVHDLKELSIIPIIKDSFDLPLYIAHIKSLVKDNTSNANTQIYLLKRLKEIEKAPIKINDYINDSSIEEMARTLAPEEPFFAELCCLRLSRENNYSPRSNYRTFDNILNENNYSLKSIVSENLEYYMNYDDILLRLVDFSPKNLLNEVAKTITYEYSHSAKVDLLSILSNFEKILANSDIESEVLLTRLNDWEKDKEAITIQHIPEIPLRFFEEAIKVDNNLTQYCLSLAKEYLQSSTQEEWKGSLMSKDFRYTLFTTHHPMHIQNCYDAFKELLRGYASGESNHALDKETANSLINIYVKLGQDIKGFFIAIRDLFIGMSSITNEKIKYFGPWLFKYAKLNDKPNILSKIFPTELIDDKTIIDLFIENKHTLKDMFVKEDNNLEFINKMKDFYAGKYKESEPFIDFYNHLEIEKYVNEESD